MTDQEINEAAFAAAYRAWKRRDLTDEPQGECFKLHPVQAEAIARRVHREFEKKVVDQTLSLLSRENQS